VGCWDADQARDRLRRYVLEEMGSQDSVWIVAETGFVKKGLHWAGVKRQYSGAAGRIENSQVGVFLCYAGGAALGCLMRNSVFLAVGRGWQRCRVAGIADEVGFAIKPGLARRMMARARDAGVAPSWVTADAVYGNDTKLRRCRSGAAVKYLSHRTSQEGNWSYCTPAHCGTTAFPEIM